MFILEVSQSVTSANCQHDTLCQHKQFQIIHWNNIWLRARSHMTYTTFEDRWPHYMVLGRPLDTFIWALTISWARSLAHVWSDRLVRRGEVRGYLLTDNFHDFPLNLIRLIMSPFPSLPFPSLAARVSDGQLAPHWPRWRYYSPIVDVSVCCSNAHPT